jgi:hypothetical protein
MADGLAGKLGQGQSDFGGVGLMQTPTARMAPSGTMSVSASSSDPYRRYNFFFQPTDWFEGGFRYVEIENRQFLASEEDRPNLDKGFDIKLRLLEETRRWPQLALGLRDVGGTTLFGAEYLAASKRWNDLDFTLGLGWGYLGNAADIDSPLGWLDARFDDRPRRVRRWFVRHGRQRLEQRDAVLRGDLDGEQRYRRTRDAARRLPDHRDAIDALDVAKRDGELLRRAAGELERRLGALDHDRHAAVRPTPFRYHPCVDEPLQVPLERAPGDVDRLGEFAGAGGPV